MYMDTVSCRCDMTERGVKHHSIKQSVCVQKRADGVGTKSRLVTALVFSINPFLHIYSFKHIEEKALGKHCGKGQNCAFHNVLYAICILKSFNSHISVVVGGFFQFRMDSKWCIREWFSPFSNKPWFLRVCSTSLSKTLWEKEKLLVRSNFSFSHSVFYPFR